MDRKTDIRISEITSTGELSEEDREVLNSAIEASRKAYAPYSGFRVGAAVRLGNGVILSGNNRENAAFPSGSCAERTVLSYAGANWPGETILTLAVCASRDDMFTDEPVTPCGNCRQLIAEEEDRTGSMIRIILYGEKRIMVVKGIDPLLPLRFKKEDLKG